VSPHRPACPPIYICIRRTIDWADERAVEAELLPEMRPKVAVWNAIFAMPYHVFRHRAKEIAARNLGAVAGVQIAPREEIPVGSVIVPVDDDDWFAPDLALHLQRAWTTETRGCYWRRFVLEARTGMRWRALFGRRWETDHSRYMCGTNNYAVLNIDGWSKAVTGHTGASRLFEASSDEIAHIPAMLSIQSRNISSQTVMGWRRPTITPGTLRRRFRRYRRLYAQADLPGELGWAAPYMSMMAELMEEAAAGG
jgi:hypothetical protein